MLRLDLALLRLVFGPTALRVVLPAQPAVPPHRDRREAATGPEIAERAIGPRNAKITLYPLVRVGEVWPVVALAP